MLYKLLATRNPEHDVELIRKLRLLYKAGYELKKSAKLFLQRAPNEGEEYYDYRCTRASYMPYFGGLIDYLVGALFQNQIQVLPAGDADNPDTPGELPDKDFYPEYAANADDKCTPFARIMRMAVTEALITQCAWIASDMPPAVDAENRRDEEEQGGARAYSCLIPYEQVFDYCESDKKDELVWCIIGRRVQERHSPEEGRDTYRDQFTLWRKDQKTGVVSFERYETEPVKVGSEPKGDDDLQPVEQGSTTFQKIPIDRMDLPFGLWAGNKIGPLSEEHFARRSEMVGAMARSLVEIPTVTLGPEIPEVGGAINLTQTDPHRGDDPVEQFKRKGYSVLGAGDKLSFVGPSGTAYTITDKQLNDLRDEIHRTVHSMALVIENSAAAVGRSGDSKAEDRSATEIVLEYLGAMVRELAVKVYGTISDARDEDVKWVAHGLDSFDIDDRTALVEEAPIMMALDTHSPTWRKEYETQLLLGTVPGCSPETKAQIQQEIADGLAHAEDLKAATAAAQASGVAPTLPDGSPNPAYQNPAGGGTKPPAPSPMGSVPPKAGPPPPAPPKMAAKAPPKPAAPAVPPGKPPTPPAPTDATPIHLKTATTAGIAETVYNQLAEDFPPEAIAWVRAAHWEGPLDVPLDSIDTSGKDTWSAADEPDRVSFFDGQIEEGKVKPVILVNEPNQSKLIVADGHHRVTAALDSNSGTIPAFVAHVGAVSGPWDEMHSSQRRGDSGPQ